MFQHIRIYVDIQILESNFSSLNYNSWSKCYTYEESLKLVYQTLLPFFSLFSKMWICNIYINNLTFFLEYFFHCKFIYNFVCYIQIGHYWPIPFFSYFSMLGAIYTFRCIYPSTYSVVSTLCRELFLFWYSFLFVFSYWYLYLYIYNSDFNLWYCDMHSILMNYPLEIMVSVMWYLFSNF